MSNETHLKMYKRKLLETESAIEDVRRALPQAVDAEHGQLLACLRSLENLLLVYKQAQAFFEAATCAKVPADLED